MRKFTLGVADGTVYYYACTVCDAQLLRNEIKLLPRIFSVVKSSALAMANEHRRLTGHNAWRVHENPASIGMWQHSDTRKILGLKLSQLFMQDGNGTIYVCRECKAESTKVNISVACPVPDQYNDMLLNSCWKITFHNCGHHIYTDPAFDQESLRVKA